MVLGQLVIAMVSAMIYSLSVYLRKNEPFDAVKFITTAIVGIVIGGVMIGLGVPITEEGVVTQIATYAGLTVVIQNVLTKIMQYLKPPT